MMHNIDFSLASSAAVETALGQQIERIRLSRNLTQAQLADQAGISRSTLTRFVQDDKGISLDSFIRIMQALQLHDHLAALLPDPGISPLQQLANNGKDRQRARQKKKTSRKYKSSGDRETGNWTWGDEEQQQ